MAPCPPLETVVWHDLFLGRPRSRRYPKFNIRRDIPEINGVESRVKRQNLLNDLRARLAEWLSAFGDRNEGPSLKEMDLIIGDIEGILRKIKAYDQR